MHNLHDKNPHMCHNTNHSMFLYIAPSKLHYKILNMTCCNYPHTTSYKNLHTFPYNFLNSFLHSY